MDRKVISLANERADDNEELDASYQLYYVRGRMIRHTETRAHSPRYFTNQGRVTSKNAGAANMAVATPALKAYLISGSINRAPSSQNDCFIRPVKDNDARDGVCIVLGACGFTFGNLRISRSFDSMGTNVAANMLCKDI